MSAILKKKKKAGGSFEMQYYGKTPVENTRDAVIESTVIKKKGNLVISQRADGMIEECRKRLLMYFPLPIYFLKHLSET